MAFTGYSYATGLAALGQGIDSWAEGMEKAEKRRLLGEAFKNNPQAAAAAMADPSLGLGVLKNQEEEARRKAGQAAWDREMGSGGAPLAPLGGAAPSTPPLSPLGSPSLGTPQAGSSGPNDPLDLVMKYESGGKNIHQNVVPAGGGYNPSTGTVTGPSSASGYFQMIDPTWRKAATMAGIDTGQYPTAISAPYDVQRKAAEALFAKEGFAPWAPYNASLRSAIMKAGGPESFTLREGGAPQQSYQVAGNGPAPSGPAQAGNPAAIADAQRVSREGGPRQVLSPENPAVQPGAQSDGEPPLPPAPQDAGTPPQDGRVRLAQGGTSDAPLPISPGQFLVQRQQGKDGLLQPPAPFRPPPPTPELQRLDQIARAYEAQARVDPSGHATQLAAQYRNAYLQARREQGQAALADWKEQTRLYREQQAELRKQERDGWTPVTDPAERARLGADPAYKGVILRQAGGDVKFPGKPATEVNLTQKAEGTYDQNIAKQNSDYFGELQTAGRNAGKQINTLRIMEKLIDTPNFYSGRGGEYALSAKRAMEALGLTDVGSSASTELYSKLAKQAVIDKLGGSLGAGVSNSDVTYISGTAANLENTREGNRAVVQLGIALAKREQEVAGLARKYASEHSGRLDAGFHEYLADWAEKNPLDLKGVKALYPPAGSAPPGSPPGAAEPAPPPVRQVGPPSAAAIDYLRANPALRDQFDVKYGAGAAARVLGQ